MRLFELAQTLVEAKNDTVVFTFGRFNPPTIGHEKLVQKVLDVAKANNANHVIFLSQTQKPKKDPLFWSDKMNIFHQMFPDANVSTNREVKNPYGALMTLGEKYDNVIMVTGADRVDTFRNGMAPYLEEYGIKNFDVVNAGIRDPDAEGVEGMSASKARSLAVQGNFKDFAQTMPSTINKATKKIVYDKIRQNQ